METHPPIGMLNDLEPHEKEVVRRWWHSLPTDERNALHEMYPTDDQSLPTFSFDLVDEFDSPVHDDAGDRYEYLVNHEHKVQGSFFFGNRSIPLPAISLLSPCWPPYSKESRFDEWEPTDSLYAQMQDELERSLRGTDRSRPPSSTLSSLWHAEQDLKQQQNKAVEQALKAL